MDIRGIFTFITYIQFAMSATVNIIVLVLVVRRNHTLFQKFRLILGHMAVINLHSSIVLILLQPNHYFEKAFIIISSRNPLINNIHSITTAITFIRFLMADYTGLHCAYPLNYVAAVAFRYLQLLRPFIINEMLSVWKICLIFLSIHLFSFMIMVLTYNAYYLTPETLSSLSSEFHIPQYFSIFIASDLKDRVFLPIIFIIHVFIVIISIVCVKFCAYRLNNYLRDNEEHLHATTIYSHRSLIMCFHIKSILPVAFTIPPLILNVISIAIIVPHELATFIFNLSGWMPLLDGVLSIYYVLPYRRAVIHFVMNRKKLCTVSNNVGPLESHTYSIPQRQ